jgi:replication initiation protein RepC
MQSHTTTPFGRRSLSPAMVASQAATKGFASRLPALTEAKTPLGVTDRALSVLHALLSFHQETALRLPGKDAGAQEGEAAAGIIVFPSNRELSIRAHGMAPATLRRHIAMRSTPG